ncbi:Integrator complex subunit 8-like [Oopsacas minuta]|uniref:Integrator complex subunit 8-like n=1 Tax=Oopsacas minuta TaxID=111878 RepID=A0AAV7K1E1_9METZ|nr:Integrator complex subunit 8-like [Oopsacas minuta]
MSSQVLTWYDFLLKTADIDEYLLDYTTSPTSHPKPSELLIAFLQRLSRLEDESTLRDNTQYALRLADLSLKVVGHYFNWSLPELDNCLTLPLQYRLMTVLNTRFPADSEKTFADLSDNHLVAMYLDSCWTVRFICSLSIRDYANKKVEIKQVYNQLHEDNVQAILTDILSLENDLQPSISFLCPKKKRFISINNLLIQTHFELGRYLFCKMKYTQALQHFTSASDLFSQRSARDNKDMLWVTSQQLQAFFDTTLLLNSEDSGRIIGQRWNLESMLVSPHFPPLLDLMVKTQLSQQLGKGFYHRILDLSSKVQPSTRSKTKPDSTPSSKRSRLDPSPEEAFWKLSLLSAVKCHSFNLSCPALLHIFRQMDSRDEFDCFHRILSKLGFSKKKDTLSRSHTSLELSSIPLHLAHLLFSNMLPDLREIYDSSYLYKSVHTSNTPPDSLTLQYLPSLSADSSRIIHSKPAQYMKLSSLQQAYLSQWHLLNLCDIPAFNMLISTIGNKSSLDIQHFASQWTGSHKPFIQNEQVPDYTLLTKINAALHIGSILQSNRHLELSHKFYRSALDSCQNASLKPPLTIPIHEKFVFVQLETEIIQLKQSPGHIFPQSLVENAKHVFSNTSNTPFLHMAAAFLLNCKEYQFFTSDNFGDQAKFATGLANCCLALMESSEVRRHGRHIFDAIFRILENQREQDSDVKTGLQIFFNNLVERFSLSISISCFVKLVTLVENPKWEISSEYPNCWPAAISNVDRLERSQVCRFFLSLVDHAIELHPNNCHAWLITKADYLFNNSNYSMALKLYIEAGALASSYFETAVPPDIWAEPCIRHMLDCLNMLREIRFALLLSQLLRPADHNLTLNLIKELLEKPNESFIPNNFYKYIWDMTALEYLGYFCALRKLSEFNDYFNTIPADLNINNSEEVLSRAVQWRRTEFLRRLADYLLIV